MRLPLFLLFFGAILCVKSAYCLSRDGKEAAALKRDVLVPPDPNMPVFQIEEGNPDFPEEDHGEIQRRLGEAFNDMLKMAGLACATFMPTEPVYLRYFGEEDSDEPEFVRSLICSIAGYDDPQPCDPLAVAQNPPRVNPKFTKLTIIAGHDVRLGVPEEDVVPAASTFQGDGLEDITDDEDAAITEITKRGLDYPTLKQIETDRTCQGLGPADSGLMTSLGAHLLHEMIHWRYLIRTAANQEDYDQIIPRDLYDLEFDAHYYDYPVDYRPGASIETRPNDPPDGYGPAHAAQLVLNNNGDSFDNADNYRWYVVSKYWQHICGRPFDKQEDPFKDDRMIPPGSNGQVPYPGEVPEEQIPPPRARLFAIL